MFLNYVKKKWGEKLEASHDHIFIFYNKLPTQQHIFQRSITPQSSVSHSNWYQSLSHLELYTVILFCWYYWGQNTKNYKGWVLYENLSVSLRVIIWETKREANYITYKTRKVCCKMSNVSSWVELETGMLKFMANWKHQCNNHLLQTMTFYRKSLTINNKYVSKWNYLEKIIPKL